MGSKWRKAKMALGLNMCLYVPKTREEEEEPATAPPPSAARVSDAVSLSPDPTQTSDSRVSMPTTPTPSSSGLRLSKHGAKSSKAVVGGWVVVGVVYGGDPLRFTYSFSPA
ncbi:unnamed protein product [Cuscuta campestris]|uniref:Uncharacterized protein n=1 Tax=Cuscuta campestris TaxID=132261 RepID=A0A484NDG8_9ASTE|nr:unnamed protein product [Cuscuta campestris]